MRFILFHTIANTWCIRKPATGGLPGRRRGPLRAWDGAYVGAKGLARGRSHAIRPWPDQEAYEGKDGAANETLAIYFWQTYLWN